MVWFSSRDDVVMKERERARESEPKANRKQEREREIEIMLLPTLTKNGLFPSSRQYHRDRDEATLKGCQKLREKKRALLR